MGKERDLCCWSLGRVKHDWAGAGRGHPTAEPSSGVTVGAQGTAGMGLRVCSVEIPFPDPGSEHSSSPLGCGKTARKDAGSERTEWEAYYRYSSTYKQKYVLSKQLGVSRPLPILWGERTVIQQTAELKTPDFQSIRVLPLHTPPDGSSVLPSPFSSMGKLLGVCLTAVIHLLGTPRNTRLCRPAHFCHKQTRGTKALGGGLADRWCACKAPLLGKTGLKM